MRKQLWLIEIKDIGDKNWVNYGANIYFKTQREIVSTVKSLNKMKGYQYRGVKFIRTERIVR